MYVPAVPAGNTCSTISWVLHNQENTVPTGAIPGYIEIVINGIDHFRRLSCMIGEFEEKHDLEWI